ncbi:MAG: shikimate dehydrogenase [Cyanobacteria bacterium SIG31]|nr:shikimate dehydrogenase [Cyanobacteria bacterium SIG31]
MYKLGIIGFPLTHSISAAIQKAGFESLGLAGSYDVLETSPEDLISRIKYLKTNDYNGFNVTIPLKVPMSLFLDDIDDYANIAGCVNTVKILEDRSFIGYNTDIYGFKKAIPADVDLVGKTASILGTGGASRAAVVGLAEKGIKNIDFYTRNIINSRQTLDYMRAKFPQIEFNVYQIQNIRSLKQSAIIVNATPIGMKGFLANEMPLEERNFVDLAPDTVIYDIVYNPIQTVLLKEAKKHGLRTISGLDMLIYQAQRAIEIWTDKIPDANLMKIAAMEALN